MLPSTTVVRGVFVGAEVWSLVGDDAKPEARFEKVSGRARARLDHFSAGKNVVFALSPTNKSIHSDIARNAPISDGVVDVRITDPRPKIRIFGCFAKCDVLVLLTWATREGLDWPQEVSRCKSQWKLLFPSTPPLIGSSHEHYISNPFIPG
jgi:hypothetical protein